MKIQIISNGDLTHLQDRRIFISGLSNPNSLDEFDVNVIDISTDTLWRNSQSRVTRIDSINDFVSIREMVERKETSAIIYVLPRNSDFYFDYNQHYRYNGGYQQIRPLKDCLPGVADILLNVLPFAVQPIPIIYENTTTEINGLSYTASFYFENGYYPLTKSNSSNKITTINFGDSAFLTTLQVLESPEKLINFIEHLIPPTEPEKAPQWAQEIKILNDEELSSKIEKAQEQIYQLNELISAADKDLQENARIKSILYTNGDELVEMVFSILEKLLDCDLSVFVDEKKEDFQIKKEGYTLIGEIKGVTSNIKNEHISQVDVHYQGYMDKLAEEGLQENVHQVLIMNPFRNKPLSEREPVHDTQIKLAERNGCLIIETTTLLKLYEKFVAGGIDVGTCEKLFTEKTGLLKESDF